MIDDTDVVRTEKRVCPVCGGPTDRTVTYYRWGQNTPEFSREVEICWNGCLLFTNEYYECTGILAGEHVWRWSVHDGTEPNEVTYPDDMVKTINRMADEMARFGGHPEADALHRAVTQDRYDKQARDVLADWLEEHGRDDEAQAQRAWTRESQEGRDHMLRCAIECRVTPKELMEAAEKFAAGGVLSTLHLGHETPEIMYNTEEFWRHYRAATGHKTNKTNPGFFVRCAC